MATRTEGRTMSHENEQPLDTASRRPSRLGRASLILGLIIPAVMILNGSVFPFAMLESKTKRKQRYSRHRGKLRLNRCAAVLKAANSRPIALV